MTAREFMDFLHILERLKCNTRHGWTSTGRRESVAEHSYRLCAMAFLLRNEFPELDMNKVLRMCIVHDWGEAVTGDIPSFLKTEADETVENSAVEGLTALLPEQKEELDSLFAELLALETPESRLSQSPGQDRGRHPAQRGPARHLDRAREDPEPRVRHGGLRPFPPAARAAGDRRGGHAPQAGRWEMTREVF